MTDDITASVHSSALVAKSLQQLIDSSREQFDLPPYVDPTEYEAWKQEKNDIKTKQKSLHEQYISLDKTYTGRDRYLERLSTYSAPFISNTTPVTADQCAMHGWIDTKERHVFSNTQVFRLSCQQCSAVLDVPNLTGANPEFLSVKRIYQRYPTFLNQNHSDVCFWHTTSCHISVCAFPLVTTSDAFNLLESQAKLFQHWGNELPVISTSFDQSKMRILHRIVKAIEDIDVFSFPQQQLTEIQETAYLLPMFGWHCMDDHNYRLLNCISCFRHVLVSNYLQMNDLLTNTSNATQTQSSPPSRPERINGAFDPLNEHRPYCPWRNRDIARMNMKDSFFVSPKQPLNGYEWMLEIVCKEWFRLTNQDEKHPRHDEFRRNAERYLLTSIANNQWMMEDLTKYARSRSLKRTLSNVSDIASADKKPKHQNTIADSHHQEIQDVQTENIGDASTLDSTLTTTKSDETTIQPVQNDKPSTPPLDQHLDVSQPESPKSTTTKHQLEPDHTTEGEKQISIPPADNDSAIVETNDADEVTLDNELGDTEPKEMIEQVQDDYTLTPNGEGISTPASWGLADTDSVTHVLGEDDNESKTDQAAMEPEGEIEGEKMNNALGEDDNEIKTDQATMELEGEIEGEKMDALGEDDNENETDQATVELEGEIEGEKTDALGEDNKENKTDQATVELEGEIEGEKMDALGEDDNENKTDQATVELQGEIEGEKVDNILREDVDDSKTDQATMEYEGEVVDEKVDNGLGENVNESKTDHERLEMEDEKMDNTLTAEALQENQPNYSPDSLQNETENLVAAIDGDEENVDMTNSDLDLLETEDKSPTTKEGESTKEQEHDAQQQITQSNTNEIGEQEADLESKNGLGITTEADEKNTETAEQMDLDQAEEGQQANDTMELDLGDLDTTAFIDKQEMTTIGDSRSSELVKIGESDVQLDHIDTPQDMVDDNIMTPQDISDEKVNSSTSPPDVSITTPRDMNNDDEALGQDIENGIVMDTNGTALEDMESLDTLPQASTEIGVSTPQDMIDHSPTTQGQPPNEDTEDMHDNGLTNHFPDDTKDTALDVQASEGNQLLTSSNHLEPATNDQEDLTGIDIADETPDLLEQNELNEATNDMETGDALMDIPVDQDAQDDIDETDEQPEDLEGQVDIGIQQEDSDKQVEQDIDNVGNGQDSSTVLTSAEVVINDNKIIDTEETANLQEINIADNKDEKETEVNKEQPGNENDNIDTNKHTSLDQLDEGTTEAKDTLQGQIDESMVVDTDSRPASLDYQDTDNYDNVIDQTITEVDRQNVDNSDQTASDHHTVLIDTPTLSQHDDDDRPVSSPSIINDTVETGDGNENLIQLAKDTPSTVPSQSSISSPPNDTMDNNGDSHVPVDQQLNKGGQGTVNNDHNTAMDNHSTVSAPFMTTQPDIDQDGNDNDNDNNNDDDDDQLHQYQEDESATDLLDAAASNDDDYKEYKDNEPVLDHDDDLMEE